MVWYSRIVRTGNSTLRARSSIVSGSPAALPRPGLLALLKSRLDTSKNNRYGKYRDGIR